MISQFDLLKQRRFLPLFLTQFFGALNDNFFRGALASLIVYSGNTLSPHAGLLSVIVAAVFILPFFLFSAVSGQIADKYEMSRLIRLSKIAELGVMVGAVYGFYTHNILLLIILMFLKGIQATFFGPLKYAILPSVLGENELIAGNGVIDASTFLAILIGTIFGTTLIFLPYGSLIVSGILLLWALIGLTASFSIPKTVILDKTLKINLNFIQETFKLMNYTRQQTRIFLSILAISWFWFFGMTFLAQFPVYTREIIHAKPAIMTLFLSLFSIGIASGSLLCNRLLKGKIDSTYVPMSIFGMSIFSLDLYHASHYFMLIPTSAPLLGLVGFLAHLQGLRILADLFCMAMMGGLFIVPLYAILQHEGESSHLSRIIASNNIINSIFMGVSTIMVGILLACHVSVAQIFHIVAILNIFVAIYICRLLPAALPRTVVQALCKLFYRVDIHGMENYYAAGERVVIIANHLSYLDACLFAAFLPEELTFAVNTVVANQWWVKPFLFFVNTFPVDATKPMAIKSLIEYVRQNKRCVIFPEGRVTVTGALMKIYEGPGMIADKAQAKLLPIRIEGAEYTLFSRLKGKVPVKWFPKITITILPPQAFELDQQCFGRKRRQIISAKLYDLMRDMLLTSSDYKKPLFYEFIQAAKLQGGAHIIAEDIRRIPINYRKLLMGAFVLGHEVKKISRYQEKIGILLPNTIANAVLFLGCQAYGRIPAMLNFSAGAKNLLSACQTAQIRTVYTSREFIQKAKLEPVLDYLLNYNIKIVYLENTRKSINIISKLLSLLFSVFPKTYYKFLHKIKTDQDLERLSEQPAVTLFTSGSEGAPKAVLLSHANILANCVQISTSIDFGPQDQLFNALPVFHSFGLTGGMILPLLRGTRVFFYPSPLHFRIIPELVYDTSSTILFGTDTFLARYAKCAHPYDFYSIRYVFAGAEKLRDETRHLWSEKFGVRVLEGYGATETSPVLSLNTPMRYKQGTVGKLLPGIQYKIEPVPGIPEGGQLWVSGPNIMMGYLFPEKPGHVVPPPHNWYDTGDIVDIDSEGFIRLKGRVKRFAKIAGEMISLGLVEDTIGQLWPDYYHAVINLPDDNKGEKLVLITNYPEINAQTNQKEINQFFKQQGLSELSIPKKIQYIKTMPLLGTGKIDYVTLLSRLGFNVF